MGDYTIVMNGEMVEWVISYDDETGQKVIILTAE